eukprot:756509-Hanusia_phi.AAC.2
MSDPSRSGTASLANEQVEGLASVQSQEALVDLHAEVCNLGDEVGSHKDILRESNEEKVPSATMMSGLCSNSPAT